MSEEKVPRFTREQLRPMFEAMLPELRHAAWSMGYALGVHGTLSRDLDLIAAPWIDTAASPEQLVRSLAESVGGGEISSHIARRPHGRQGWVIYPKSSAFVHNWAWCGYIDVSVMPRTSG